MFLISHKTVQAGHEHLWRTALKDGRITDTAGYAEFMLGKVSRTFALNIQVLPLRLRHQVLLAYLFCRMADTLEDDGELDYEGKIRLLESFRALFRSGSDAGRRLEDFRSGLPAHWAESEKWDRLLVYHCQWIFPQLQAFPRTAVALISACLDEMCSGMIRFTTKQSLVRDGRPLIESMQDLDDYCYYMAGTVGNLLCDLFALHSRLIGNKRAQALKALSVSFGLGLQLTNILKDIREDSRRNVLFIPQSLLERESLTAGAFLAPEGREGSLRVLDTLIRKAKAHLEDALAYSCLLPRLEPRLRLFCLWPLFMAAETLVLLAQNRPDFQGGTKAKITRDQVKRIVGATSAACWSNLWVRGLFRKSMSRLDTLLAMPVGARV